MGTITFVRGIWEISMALKPKPPKIQKTFNNGQLLAITSNNENNTNVTIENQDFNMNKIRREMVNNCQLQQ